jgi:hypothetical protein
MLQLSIQASARQAIDRVQDLLYSTGYRGRLVAFGSECIMARYLSCNLIAFMTCNTVAKLAISIRRYPGQRVKYLLKN